MKQLNIKQWWAWLEWISKANKPRANADCSPDKPQQLNHHRWKKHTMYPKYISSDSKQSTIAEWTYGTHMWQYILNINYMFKYIGNTNCDETWWMHFYLFICILFSDAHFWTWVPTIIMSTLSSPHLKKHKDKICFLFVCKICSYAFCLVFSGLLVSLLLSCNSVYSMCLKVLCFLYFNLLYFIIVFLLCTVSSVHVICMHVLLICCASSNVY